MPDSSDEDIADDLDDYGYGYGDEDLDVDGDYAAVEVADGDAAMAEGKPVHRVGAGWIRKAEK